ncbi:putative EF-hand domain pair protein [Rosa chinensis]|uniref:Calcineurin B-like protein n=1 Tax=Rosa chinensis TaxID=74649 RepID=A0A2P6SIF2_ROSCH|nr:putative EF-hand domain pair protein [Rosa chinensis]
MNNILLIFCHSEVYSLNQMDVWELAVSVSEVESLYELYKKLSSSVVKDGLIHKIFDLFDVNKNEHIECEEFVHTLSVFHPKTPDEVKITCKIQTRDIKSCIVHFLVFEVSIFPHGTVLLTHVDTKMDIIMADAFKLYDLRHTGYIEREEASPLYSYFGCSFSYPGGLLTFMEADGKADGRIDEEEWKEYVAKNPSLLKNMTLPSLMYVLTLESTSEDISLAFPSFVLNTQATSHN